MDYKKLLEYINFVALAHQEKVNEFGKTKRKLPSGEENPYFLHPLWCAIMILTEPTLSKEVRENGALALLFHDVIEDTTVTLPSLPEKVRSLISEMTVPKLPEYNYSSWEFEKQTILEKPIEIQLLKLYDKTATLSDMVLEEKRHREWVEIVRGMAVNVEKKYGKLNIVVLAEALANQRLAK